MSKNVVVDMGATIRQQRILLEADARRIINGKSTTIVNGFFALPFQKVIINIFLKVLPKATNHKSKTHEDINGIAICNWIDPL